LYLHGPTGCGKSFLVARCLDRLGESRTLVTTGKDLGRLLGQQESVEPLDGADVLVVEDVAGLPATASEGLATLLDRRGRRRLPVVTTAAVGPAQLGRHSARLRSRLAGGLVVLVPPPGPDSRRAFLSHQAAQHGLRLSDDALAWLAQQPAGSYRVLLGVVGRLAMPPLGPEPLTLAEAKARLADDATDTTSVDRIAREVGRFYRVQAARLRGKSRQRAALVPRQVGMYLARLLTGLSLEAIGAYFGGRDHATVLHACRKVARALDLDPALAGAVRTLRAALG